jgi:hypothetical protein
MPQGLQADGEMHRSGVIARRADAYPPEDARSSPSGRYRHAEAPALERARQALGILTARKAAKLHHPSCR